MTYHCAHQVSRASYEVIAFEDEAHARAYIAVNHLDGFRPLDNAYGRRLPDVDKTVYLGERIESLALTIALGEETDATPRTDRLLAPTSMRPSRTYRAYVVSRTLKQGQRIGLRNAQDVIPATVLKLGYASIVVAIDNGRGRNQERVIDCSTVGTTNSLTAIVTEQVA